MNLNEARSAIILGSIAAAIHLGYTYLPGFSLLCGCAVIASGMLVGYLLGRADYRKYSGDER